LVCRWRLQMQQSKLKAVQLSVSGGECRPDLALFTPLRSAAL
jgi:hypothetical protein